MDRSEPDPVQSWYSPPVPDQGRWDPWPGPFIPGPNPPPPDPVRDPPHRPSWRRATAAVAAMALSAAIGSGATWAVMSAEPDDGTTARAGVTTGVTAASVSGTTVAGDMSLVDVIADAEVSVVTVTATAQEQGLRRMPVESTAVGSGIIVTPDGYILTNAHVIDGATTLTVELLDGSEYPASVVDAESDADLALLKIDASGLAPASLGDSTSLRVGQTAIAIGSPLGTYTGSVTLGIISALDRDVTVSEGQWQRGVALTDLIQTDAAINEGNSGGALLDASGQVIGITTAVATSAQGVGFAIPIEAAASLLALAGAS